jgi:hypothetical protein
MYACSTSSHAIFDRFGSFVNAERGSNHERENLLLPHLSTHPWRTNARLNTEKQGASPSNHAKPGCARTRRQRDHRLAEREEAVRHIGLTRYVTDNFVGFPVDSKVHGTIYRFTQ